MSLRGGPQPATSVTVGASFMVYDGYGSMAEYLVCGMARAGATVNVVPLDLRPEGLSAQVRDLIGRSQPEVGAPTLYHSWLRADLQRFRAAPDLFIHTTWESSRLPADWPAQVNQTRAVIVPTRFVARICRDSGVTVPLEVVPDGVDPQVYRCEERPERPSLTTLIVANMFPRKHTREAIAAWKIAFAGDPHARLIIKARLGRSTYTLDDPRITLVVESETSRGIAHWYRQADVLLALGSEGFGLPLIEGMATGLPVIALSSEGQGDVCEEAGDLLLPVAPARWEPCDEAPYGPCGVRGVPGVEDVAARLRWVAGHRDEARDLGRAASEWALRHRDVWEKGPAVLDVLERHARPRRPLRRVRTLWVAPRTSPCGVADYTAWLAAAMPGGVRLTTERPDPRGLCLLHVQHADRMFDDVELTQYVREARQVAPVVITEHAVGPVARAWECEADALVALTPPGVERLQSRWPSTAVHYLPHGCHTWFPPRKKVRGRVLGAFGFLAPHKGFWRLLDVLREVEGTELLLFSQAKSAEIQARWEAAAQGLPVRRIGEALPVEEVARRLAAEADILVFWYDEVCRHAAASGAVRVGLASGVPVLASQTCWFSDLTQVTYQPGDLVDGVRRLLEDTPLRDQLTAAARDYCHEHSWPRTAQRHLALWQALESA